MREICDLCNRLKIVYRNKKSRKLVCKNCTLHLRKIKCGVCGTIGAGFRSKKDKKYRCLGCYRLRNVDICECCFELKIIQATKMCYACYQSSRRKFLLLKI